MDNFSLFEGYYPADPKFYYYKSHNGKNGCVVKKYYFYMDNKIVTKDKIPVSTLELIKEYDPIYIYITNKNNIQIEKQKRLKNFQDKFDKNIEMIEKLQNDIKKLEELYGEEAKKYSSLNEININHIPFNENNYNFYYKKVKNTKYYYTYKDYISVKDFNYKAKILGLLEKKNNVEKRYKSEDICEDIKELIEEFNPAYRIPSKIAQISDLEKKNNSLILSINRSQKKIDKYYNIINKLCEEYPNQMNDAMAKEKNRERNNIKGEYEQKKKQKFEEFFKQKYSWYKAPPKKEKEPETKNFEKEKEPESESEPKHKCYSMSNMQILKYFNINDRKEWKDWLRNNHPDKGGNTEDCQYVISAGRNLGY